MNTRELEVFLAVAASGSVTQAASIVGCSQPSVTRMIQELEAELGFELLHRVGRRVQLSEEGVAFEEEARRLLTSFGELAARAKTIAAGKGRVLRIAATPALAGGLLPLALARMPKDALPPETHLTQHSASVVAQEVRAGRADIGFSSLPLDMPGLDVLRLYGAPDVLALRQGDALAELETVPLSALRARPVVTMIDPLRFQRGVDQALGQEGVELGTLVRANTAALALQIVRRTGAVAVVDPVTAYGFAFPDIVIRPLQRQVPFYWGVIVGSGRHMREQTRRLADEAEAVALATIPGITQLDPTLAGRLVVPEEPVRGREALATRPVDGAHR